MGPVADCGLVEDVPDVGLDGRLGNVMELGDLAVGETSGDRKQHLALPSGEPLDRMDCGIAGAGLGGDANGKDTELPLVSILRDTLGDTVPENDRLRYVWMLTFTRPSFGQKLAASVPFLYTRTTNKKSTGSSPPPPIADINPTGKVPWNTIFSLIFKKLI